MCYPNPAHLLILSAINIMNPPSYLQLSSFHFQPFLVALFLLNLVYCTFFFSDTICKPVSFNKKVYSTDIYCYNRYLLFFYFMSSDFYASLLLLLFFLLFFFPFKNQPVTYDFKVTYLNIYFST